MKLNKQVTTHQLTTILPISTHSKFVGSYNGGYTYLLGSNGHNMAYEIITTKVFDGWLDSLKDSVTRRRIAKRLLRVEEGNFGDYKALGESLYELRLFFGTGYRIYYTPRGEQIVLLLVGGDKSTQSRDIDKARELLDELE